MAAKGMAAGRTPGNGSGTTYAGGTELSRGAALEFERSINKAGYIDDTPVPVVVIDCDHTIEFINSAAALLAGCSPESCAGRKMWEVFDMEACRNGSCTASHAMREGHSQSGDAECVIKGRKVPVRAYASPRYDERNKVIGAIEVLQDNSEEQRFADELSRLVKAATGGHFEMRIDASKLSGADREIAEGVNQTLDAVKEKLNWYESILDAVQFPIHVLDKDMNWVFLNKAFEKLMIDSGTIRDRKEAPGKPCSSAAANICKTENCGVMQLNRGVGESHFDWHGKNCKQGTSRLVNLKGEHVGYVEVVQDLTSIVRDKDYTAHEVDRLAGNLTKLAQGDFAFDLQLKEADQHTAAAKQQFEKINQSLIAVKDAVDTMAADAHSLVKSAFAGELSTRANASRHQGVFRNIVQGFNETLDAILLPIGEGNRILAQISGGKIDELIAQTYKGDHEKMKEAVNNVAVVLQGLQKELGRLTEASRDGLLSERGKPEQFKGAYADVVGGVNQMLDAILLPIGEGNRILAQISDGKIDELIAHTYKGDHEKMKQAVNNVGVVLQGLQKELARLTEASRDGLLSERGKPEQFKGAYAEVVGGVNQMLDAILLPIGEGNRILAQISDGKIDELIAHTYKGDHEKMKQAVNNVAMVLQGLQKELARLTDASRDGLLSERGKPEQFKGAYAEVVGGVNQMLDAILLPIGEGNRILAQISNGKIDELVAQTYKGDHEKMKQAVNTLALVLQSLTLDTDMLAKAALEGKLSTRADANRHHGDFRKIVEGINATLDAVVGPMQDVSGILSKLAGGDFTAMVTTKYAGDYDLLAGAVNTVSQSVRSALEQIGHNVASLSSSAEELNKVSQSMGSSADETATQASVVSAAAEQVSNNVQTVATGADEMSASIKEIAKNTAEATRVASSAVRTAETTNETISKLGQSSTEIGQVIKVITSIAQQTNLLALNATIEAARAGEAGKGFAVVANEVKELAKETAKATEDISRKIEAIQGDTNGAVSAISQISQVIGQISDIQTTIASAIEEQSATTNEIGRTLAEAAKGSTDISKNIGGVAEAAHATTVGATETSKSAQSLEKMANDLRTLISQFRF